MNSPDSRSFRPELYALFGMAVYLERKGIVERAIPLVSRVLGCTDDEAVRFHAGERARIEAWRKESASDYGEDAVRRAHGVFRLLVRHMGPDEAERASAWFEALGGQGASASRSSL